jgi:hypothetical protein
MGITIIEIWGIRVFEAKQKKKMICHNFVEWVLIVILLTY